MARWFVTEDESSPEISAGSVETRSPTGEAFTQGVGVRGLMRPFHRSGSDLESDTGAALVMANVGQILITECDGPDGPGELPWRPEFGSVLRLLRLRQNSAALAEQARAFVAGAVKRWEPRCRVTQVTVQRDGTTLSLLVRWDLLANKGGGLVLVSGLETRVALG